MLLTKTSTALSEEQYISKARVIILQLEYATQPTGDYDRSQVAAAYRREVEFLIESTFRNNVISKLCSELDKNALVIVDYINHGLALESKLNEVCPNKRVYFIRGEVEVEERDRVKQLMEEQDQGFYKTRTEEDTKDTSLPEKNITEAVKIRGGAHGGKAKIKIIQSIGRGLRLHNNKTEVIIFDIADNLKYGLEHMKKRMRLYSKEGFKYGVKKITEKSSTKESS